MSNLALYGSALLVCLKPINLLLIFAMVALGIVFGAIPGLSATRHLDRRRVRFLYLRCSDRHSRFLFRHCHLL